MMLLVVSEPAGRAAGMQSRCHGAAEVTAVEAGRAGPGEPTLKFRN